MNTPLMTTAALVLALAAAAPALAVPPDPSALATSPVPDGFVGPLAPGQCYASMCPNAMAPAEAPLDQKMMEQAMLRNGTYIYLKQTADGSIFQNNDGSWAWSDEKMCYKSSTLDELAANPKLPASLHAAALQAQKEKEGGAPNLADKAQECASLNAGAGCADKNKGSVGIMSTRSLPGANPTGSGPKLTAAASTGETAPSFPAANDPAPTDLPGLGAGIADNFTQPGAGGNDSRTDKGGTQDFNHESQATLAAINAEVAAGAKIDPGSFGFVGTRKMATRTNAIIQNGAALLSNNLDKSDPVTGSNGGRIVSASNGR